MDVTPLVQIMQQIGIFEIVAQPRVSTDQVTLLGRVRKDPALQYRWFGFMRNVLQRCKPQDIVDFSRYYRLVRHMVQTVAGPKPDIKMIWNWRIVATEQALPVMMRECQDILEAQQKKAAMEGAMHQFATTGEGRMPIPNLQGDVGASIEPLTSGGFKSHGGGSVG